MAENPPVGPSPQPPQVPPVQGTDSGYGTPPGRFPAPVPGKLTFEVNPETFWRQYWPHITATIGAVAAVAIGVADHLWGPATGPAAWGPLVDLSLVWGGLGALGVTAVAATK